MIRSKLYKISPFIDDSFDITLRELVKYICFTKDVFDIKYSKINVDGTRAGNWQYGYYKIPEHIYITVHYFDGFSCTNAGGIEFCNIILKDSSRINVRWQISPKPPVFGKEKYFRKFDIIDLRKLKLEKLNKI